MLSAYHVRRSEVFYLHLTLVSFDQRALSNTDNTVGSKGAADNQILSTVSEDIRANSTSAAALVGRTPKNFHEALLTHIKNN